jgi:hypothetical protein
VRKAVANETKLAFLDILFYRVEKFFFGDLVDGRVSSKVNKVNVN